MSEPIWSDEAKRAFVEFRKACGVRIVGVGAGARYVERGSFDAAAYERFIALAPQEVRGAGAYSIPNDVQEMELAAGVRVLEFPPGTVEVDMPRGPSQ